MSWADEGTPPIVDRSLRRRAISQAGEGPFARREPVVITDPSSVSRAVEQVKWLPLGGKPDIDVGLEGNRVKVKGVNEGEINWKEKYVELEVDTQMYESKDPYGGFDLRYYLRFMNPIHVSWDQPWSARSNLVEGAMGGGPTREGDHIYLGGPDDQYECRADWTNRGGREDRKEGWDIYCHWMKPEEALKHNPDRAKHLVQLEEFWGKRRPLSEISLAEAEDALIKKWAETKRCPV